MDSQSQIIPTVGIVAIKNNQVLLVKHGVYAEHLTGTYGLPAGRIHENESEAETGVRKFTEETGLTTSKDNLIQLPTTYTATIDRKDGRQTFSLKVFLCINFSGRLKKINGLINETPEWVKIDNIQSLSLLPNVNVAILEGMNYLAKQK